MPSAGIGDLHSAEPWELQIWKSANQVICVEVDSSYIPFAVTDDAIPRGHITRVRGKVPSVAPVGPTGGIVKAN